MAEAGLSTSRVFVEDLRHDGKFLRATWHPDSGAFVISHWQGDVCVAATRVRAEDAARLVGLLTNGMADALQIERSRAAAAAAPSSVAPKRRLRRLIDRVVGRHEPGAVADVVPLAAQQSIEVDRRATAAGQS